MQHTNGIYLYLDVYVVIEFSFVLGHALTVVIEADICLFVLFGTLQFIIAECFCLIEGLELATIEELVLADVTIDNELTITIAAANRRQQGHDEQDTNRHRFTTLQQISKNINNLASNISKSLGNGQISLKTCCNYYQSNKTLNLKQKKMKGCISKYALQSCCSVLEGNKYNGRIRTESSESWLKPQTSSEMDGLNREELQESLRILKNGAVFALAEKEEHFVTVSRIWTEHLQLYKDKLDKLGECLSAQEELHRSHFELSQQMDEERQYWFDELSLRDEKIEHLISLIERMKEYIQQLQQGSRQKEQQLFREEQQTLKLRSMLEQSQLRNTIQSLDLGGPQQKPIEMYHSQISEEDVRKQYQQRIQEIVGRHEQEIQRIVQLYETKIQEKQQLQTQHQLVLEETPNKCSLKSLNRSRSDQDPRALHHTPSMASEPSVHNLREEIFPEEKLSQFTKELFSLPSVFHKQKSHLSHPSLDPSRDLPLKETKGSETEGEKREKEIDLFWQKTKSFAAGFFSGASVGSALSLLVLKWK